MAPVPVLKMLSITNRNEQCGEMGHIARNCPKSGFGNSYGGGGAGFGGGAGKTCYSCGGFGHMSRKYLLEPRSSSEMLIDHRRVCQRHEVLQLRRVWSLLPRLP